MQKDCTVFNIPRAEEEEQTPAPVFDEPATEPVFVSDIYNELNQIAEELEECRLRNC